MPATTRNAAAATKADDPSAPTAKPGEKPAPSNGGKSASKRARANTASQATSAAAQKKKKKEHNVDNMEVDVVDAVGDLNLGEESVEKQPTRPKRESASKPAVVKAEKVKRRSAAEVEASSEKVEEQEKRYKRLKNLELNSFAKLELKQKAAEMEEDDDIVANLSQQATNNTQGRSSKPVIICDDTGGQKGDMDDPSDSEGSDSSEVQIVEDKDPNKISEDGSDSEESAYNSEDELQRPKGKAKRGETRALIDTHRRKMGEWKQDVVVKKTASTKLKTSNLSSQQRPSHLSGIQPKWLTKSADVKLEKQKKRAVTPTEEDEFELGGFQDADVESAPPPKVKTKKNVRGVKFQPSVILIQSDSEDATPVKQKKGSKIAKTPTTVKREPAAKTSLPTNVKREGKKTKNKVSRAAAPAPATSDDHDDSAELPRWIDAAKWRAVVLPTLYHRLNSSTEPFAAFAAGSEALLQNVIAVLNNIFPGHTYKPTRTSHIVKLAYRRITERRGTFGSAALEIVDTFFSEGEFENNPTAIAAYVKWAVSPHGPAFWSRPEPQIQSDAAAQVAPDGFGQSCFVLQSVAPLLNVQGAVGDFGNPVGAFGLAMGAIERAFLLYQTGTKLDSAVTKPDSEKLKIPEFSGDNNGAMVEDYIYNIKQFSEGRWGRILADVARISGVPLKPPPTTTNVTASIARDRRNLFTPSSPPPESL